MCLIYKLIKSSNEKKSSDDSDSSSYSTDISETETEDTPNLDFYNDTIEEMENDRKKLYLWKQILYLAQR